MKIAMALVIVVLVLALVGTFMVTKSEDVKYGESTKRNTINLTVIYIILFVVLAVGVIWYIVSVI
ncbi:hypothetical protein BTO30_11420 [Domibacillus antri]|uniref:Uncharacterized protein n=1 Tax=Domibacillus antri TaxID=1714264 RepID=A0A1Q8Q476_9BACI|nr:hypothetical protein [Domibacillus antri]OLN22095.1 hypothetical protein BTO30_11420 [Domibacillus antri]